MQRPAPQKSAEQNTAQHARQSTRVALITGGGRGLGREIALRLARDGVDVILTYRANHTAAKATAAEIEALGRTAVIERIDLADSGAIAPFAERVRAALSEVWGRDTLDFLINNAGISSEAPFAEVDEARLDAQFAVNYKAPFMLTQALLDTLADGGRVLMIGTGLTRFTIPSLVAYAPMKAAVELLARYLAKELGPRGITVNAISPGALHTDFTAPAFEHAPHMAQVIARNTALGRVGETTDVAGVVALVCAPEGGWITGQRIEVSGGMFL